MTMECDWTNGQTDRQSNNYMTNDNMLIRILEDSVKRGVTQH